METNQKNLNERIALIYVEIQKLTRHFKLDRRTKNNPDDETPEISGEDEKLILAIRKQIADAIRNRDFSPAQTERLQNMASRVSESIIEEQKERQQAFGRLFMKIAHKIDALSNASLNHSIETLTTKLDAVNEKLDRPLKHRHAIDFMGNQALIVLVVAITGLFVSLWVIRDQRQFRDNDLKYRYVKMRGGATSGGIERLETIFTYDRNPDSIRIIRRQVVQYERLVKEQAEKIEQARLNASEAERLQNQAETVKKGE
jgi:hypothetical protein